MSSERNAASLRLLLSRLLAVGVSFAAVLMGAGLVSALLVGWNGSLTGAGAISHDPGDFADTLTAGLALRPFAIVQLGLLVLLATPVLRVAASVVAFIVEGDRLYATVSAAVLAILLTSIFLVR